ncbi:trypco2 family protein [Streptomyces sp. NPDC050703]|uniref:trypco2 family protein n=1 Tax=Streptomyces sp. NPDC050703 TaxID=3157218 RepID=UPI00343467D8
MIELSEVIGELRRELDEAMAAGAGERLRFELGPVEVEATFTMERSAGAGAKVRFWVIDANAGGKAVRSDAHKITLTLHPRVEGHPGRPEIAGRSADGER